MAFTDTEKVNIRRFCGFPAYGVKPYANFWMRSTAVWGQIEFVMNNIAPEEENIVRTVYLPNLQQLELDIVGARTNLDTAQAAVWTWNKNELGDRAHLFNYWRRQLCDFIGSFYGPGLRQQTAYRAI